MSHHDPHDSPPVETITLPVAELQLWLMLLQEGAHPQVQYSTNWSTMTQQALAKSKHACTEVIRLIELSCDR